MLIDKIKARVPRNAPRQAAVRLVALGVPATILLAMAATGFVRSCVRAMLGGM